MSLIAIAWCVAFYEVVECHLAFLASAHNPRPADIREILFACYASGIMIPLLLTVPALQMTRKHCRRRLSRAAICIIVCAAVALGDVTSLTILLWALLEFVY